MKQWQWLALLAGGAVVAVGGVILLEKKAPATPAPTPTPTPAPLAPSPTPPTPLPAATSTPPSIVLQPGSIVVHSANATGYYASLPTGAKQAKWLTQNGNDARMAVESPIFVQPAASGQSIAPQTFTYIDPNDGSAQASVVSVDS